MIGAGGLISLANAECERMFNYQRNEMIGAPIESLIPARLRQDHLAHRAGFAKTPSKRQMGVGRDLYAVRSDGTEFPVEIGLTPFEAPDGPGVMAFVIDISARRESERAIGKYTEELERANEGLARFAYAASHDIQEPLRKIATFSHIQKDALARNDMAQVAFAAGIMQESALHARGLVADLLNLSRSINAEYDLEPVPIKTAVSEALDNLSQAIKDKNAVLEVDLDDFEIDADRWQIVSLIQNLVSNALKYHKPGQRPVIRISARSGTPKGRVLSVADEGIGFSMLYLKDIFEPFKRLHSRDDYPGSGIGLAICKTIAARHKWTLTAHGTPLIGAKFEIGFVPA
nr:ATP-binding protein [Rhodoblastus sphagnicola]